MTAKRLPGKPTCPDCGKTLDSYTGITTKDSLRPGDWSVCGYCSAPLEWNGKGFNRLEGPALVLARLRPDFLMAEAVSREFRRHVECRVKTK